MEQTRAELERRSPFVPPHRVLEDLTGIRGVHVREPGEQASDLAVAAARKAMAEAGAGTADVDLLLFASCCQDLIEPATAHIVAAKLGLGCPAFDVKNACNSVLNALEVAGAFIECGRYRTVLIACGETPTMATRWHLPDEDTFIRALPGYTLSDAGAALLLTAGPAGENDPGLITTVFGAHSAAWNACTVESGGSLHYRPVDDEPTYVRLNGDFLRDTVLDLAPMALEHARSELESVRRSAFIAFHQISRRHYDEMCDGLDLPADRCLPAVVDHGNTASASLPLQLVRAREADRVEPGDQVALIGMASGFSAGLALIRL
ncbi:3-oxoacyl-[acyl-carrier-protein] synthase III C-terminal domain-containing protein [Streptomyces sp. P9(2023)]|uniref:3-oxoacyl-ACP synthase III family protein n=1 Tax=Streptomyces sp. P9(2023) TaxID=3064394 RepID=UPI0028F3ECC9|nr:3-oxoacyl-[acyl-carrier-protein] synthase III C-terminal domain-containing protein [Streptomyces sp. P9(2023)]MDT9686974.1 3-oxoacyl-[acyl-carrier-protein] synthase III C-terminal domain-containing protein [Streptomyces sp. P9(2023)]